MGRIKDLRMERGYTQREMAVHMGISLSTYARMEQGKHRLTTKYCCKLADILDTSVDYLLGLTDNKSPYPSIPT